MSETFSFRKYKKGWTPSFDFGFLSKPTFRDTGKGSASRTQYRSRPGEEPQSYEDIKAACQDQGALWEDPDFPAEDSSMFFKDPPSGYPDIEWLRPSEICDDPELFVAGATRMDVNQGVLGDCWLLAAVASLATDERLLHRVIPKDQSFSEDYAGVFRFQFWQYGRWIELCIDDRLPCKDGRLIYMHSDDRNEFWSALLEKAYAKLNGSYENLSGGLTSEAMTDFTGGMVERFELRDKAAEDLLKRMLKARSRSSLMGCSIDASADQMEARLDNGLIIGHAYSVTDVKQVDVETPTVSGQIPMVRVRNPWGDEHEWKGAWSDASEEWQFISDDEKEEMGLTFNHDGEFWMSFEDFVQEFQRLEICFLGPDSVTPDMDDGVVDVIERWEGTLNEGSWIRNVNAGGCRNYGSFYTNPQYVVSLEDPDEEDEEEMVTISIAVMQKERRKLKAAGGGNHSIGYAVYQVDDPDCGTLDHRFFTSRQMTARSEFINTREVCGHHKLPPGNYAIVASTFEPNEEAAFIVRVFSEKGDNTIKEMDDQTTSAEPNEEDLGEDNDEDEEKNEAGRQAFLGLAGEDGEVDAYELREILNQTVGKEFEIDGFSTDMTRSLVAMHDADISGKLDYGDFKDLLADLGICKKVFRAQDADGNGYFSSFELKRVLASLGFRLSNSTFNAIVMRYSDREGHVRFDDFVACYMKIKSLFHTFRANDEEASGSAAFEMDEFIQMTMYN